MFRSESNITLFVFIMIYEVTFKLLISVVDTLVHDKLII